LGKAKQAGIGKMSAKGGIMAVNGLFTETVGWFVQQAVYTNKQNTESRYAQPMRVYGSPDIPVQQVGYGMANAATRAPGKSHQPQRA
jgi:hypothetical protein